MKDLAVRGLQWLNAVENWLLVGLALAMVILAGLQIVLRLANQGLIWLDPLLRVLVLWIGLLGAVAAARYDKHISLDVVGRLLHGRALQISRLFTLGFAALISALMVKASIGLIALDRESGTTIFASVPMWWVELALPVAFLLLTLRFLLRALAKVEEKIETGPA